VALPFLFTLYCTCYNRPAIFNFLYTYPRSYLAQVFQYIFFPCPELWTYIQQRFLPEDSHFCRLCSTRVPLAYSRVFLLHSSTVLTISLCTIIHVAYSSLVFLQIICLVLNFYCEGSCFAFHNFLSSEMNKYLSEHY
jgi:hypothetical protein